jgi:hypothetical protein
LHYRGYSKIHGTKLLSGAIVSKGGHKTMVRGQMRLFELCDRFSENEYQKEGSRDADLNKWFSQLLSEPDKLDQIQGDLFDITDQLKNTIKKATERGEGLDEMEEKSERLKEESTKFRIRVSGDHKVLVN